ncbi:MULTISPECIES: hypothetical protein [unclassified Streptomyces]|uniref:hypothetical protein n=1 Tax=unclassified Streptomyces TaxID=2593676 RepID=UPI0022B72BFC|nr:MULTISPECIES: hypothetical protein [unclassified Streptomyces]MCZ7414932.1 hypothetical protein [Streptomyces sp. WMMC897]MCZ7431875.1 hypothetical protein [Streptomyces sp. WMMC1477]
MTSDAMPDPWQPLLAMAAPSRPAAEPGTDGLAALQLASASGAGPERDKLKHSAGPWTTAANDADGLRDSMRSAVDKLGTSHQRLGSEGAGLASVVQLDSVRSTWERRLKDARDECETLGDRLRRVAKDHGENETATEARLRRMGGR